MNFFQYLLSASDLKKLSFNLCLSNLMSSPIFITLTKFKLLLAHLTWTKPSASLNPVFLNLKIRLLFLTSFFPLIIATQAMFQSLAQQHQNGLPSLMPNHWHSHCLLQNYFSLLVCCPPLFFVVDHRRPPLQLSLATSGSRSLPQVTTDYTGAEGHFSFMHRHERHMCLMFIAVVVVLFSCKDKG